MRLQAALGDQVGLFIPGELEHGWAAGLNLPILGQGEKQHRMNFLDPGVLWCYPGSGACCAQTAEQSLCKTHFTFFLTDYLDNDNDQM